MKDIVELREIKGHPGIFVTRTPQFVSLRGSVTILEIHPPTEGERYPTVCFDGGKFRVHRLVAEAFPELIEGEKLEGYEIDHRNGITTDCRPENLRWVSHYDNMNNPVTLDKRGTTVYQFTKAGIMIDKHKSIRQASEKTKINRGQISMCCRRVKNHKTAGDYLWSYEPIPPVYVKYEKSSQRKK